MANVNGGGVATPDGVTRRSRPQWQQTANMSTSAASENAKPKLHLLNSLTREKNPFVPISGNLVKWYICGPTVYDSSHMGHARAYLSFDILRRVLSDYFGYDVFYIMNITDIDDKIIKRGRQRHLLAEYRDGRAKSASTSELKSDAKEAVKYFRDKLKDEVDPDKRKMLEEQDGRLVDLMSNLEAAKAEAEFHTNFTAFLDAAGDVLSDWLDSKYGAQISDKAVFEKLAKFYERDFMADMCKLGVRAPDVLTRVSEYVPEVIKFVQRIIDNGYAYHAKDGSVYFDTVAFMANPKHYYARLVHEAVGDVSQMDKNMRESEGELSLGNAQNKKSPSDFAVWKASKAGEPAWDSPWGPGRPGWHIECSAMCHDVAGDELDIHAGGQDLKFPHHDNEIAQCEAYLDRAGWVNYFLHCGTLRIEGMKMSKSLKNFITIKKALETYTARQLRILFLMSGWSDALDYSADGMEHAIRFEKLVTDYFGLVKDVLRRHERPNEPDSYAKLDAEASELWKAVQTAKDKVHRALCDSVDTPRALHAIRDLVAAGNVYIAQMEKEGRVPATGPLRASATFITKMLRVFGVAADNSQQLGLGGDGSATECGQDKETLLMPYLSVLADFREQVRTHAREAKAVNVLKECDRLRDEVLPELGVKLEDRISGACIKLGDRDQLLREREQLRALEATKAEEKAKKEAAKAEEAAKKAKKLAEQETAARTPPQEIFKVGEEADKYSAYDEQGIPTLLKNGDEVSKSARKKLEKVWQKQKSDHEAWLKKQEQQQQVNGSLTNGVTAH